jgi:lysophospholipase L1-like esterase
MEFRTIVDIKPSAVKIEPHDEVLLVGSCFADGIGRRFQEEKFPTTVNPYGTMYNPASVLHTVERCEAAPRFAFLTLGTNHVYIEKATGEIVDNCQKRPAALFEERELTVEECADYLRRTVEVLRSRRPDVQVVVTVSPIRYRKYGYHESQLSKATLMLSVERSTYFPAYEIMMDELRDYRFYAADMIHPSEQAVDYIWERLVETYFSASAKQWLADWHPVKQALNHRPFNAESEEYRAFMDKTMLKVEELRKKYPTFARQKMEIT